MEKEKIRFRDLSTPLKIAIVMAWAVGCLFIFSYAVGIILGAWAI